MIEVYDLKRKAIGWLEKFLVVILSAFAGTIFFTQRRMSIFEYLSLGALIIWRLILKNEQLYSFPRKLIMWTSLYVLSFFVGALLSQDRHWELTEFKKYTHLAIGGCLFVLPLSVRNRKIIIVFFYISAAIAGFVGILQYFGLMHQEWYRPHGFSAHMILYTGLLAFACSSAMIIYIFRESDLFLSKASRFFLLLVIFFTFGGILVSGSRGVWVSLVLACVVTLFLYDRRKAAIFFLSIAVVFTAITSFNAAFRSLTSSIVTTVVSYKEDSSMGYRYTLWKGSLLIFKKSPLIGCGTGNFQLEIKKLVAAKKLRDLYYKVPHDIYLNALATRGIIGFIITIGFLITLMKWGMKEIQQSRAIGGYIIILITLLTMIGGLTENNLENAKYLGASCFTIGLFGPFGLNHSCKYISMPLKKWP